jgi:hypothetical protein
MMITMTMENRTNRGRDRQGRPSMANQAKEEKKPQEYQTRETRLCLTLTGIVPDQRGVLDLDDARTGEKREGCLISRPPVQHGCGYASACSLLGPALHGRCSRENWRASPVLLSKRLCAQCNIKPGELCHSMFSCVLQAPEGVLGQGKTRQSRQGRRRGKERVSLGQVA